MPKRKKSLTGRVGRERERVKKRQAREKLATRDASPDEKVPESSVPCGTEDGAMSALPGNFPGLGSMGLPPKEEKPLARMQASPRVKMHSPAPRLPPPRGSRLFVRNEGKAPSPDSPPWVCAPPRAPGSDIGHMSGPAGQAQLDTSREEETSRKLKKDEGTLTNTKKETERILKGNLNEYNIESEMKTNGNENENNEKHSKSESDCKEKNVRHEDQYWHKASKEGKHEISFSVQGSFHQAHPMFEENAGTQCVANCLAGLAYDKLKNAKSWTTMDMDRILMTGDELYTYLQRSSLISERYLLVEELPQLFECFNRSYQFHADESFASVILADNGVNYAEFNALPLDDALQVALTDNDGCFVCFGGNTMLIGSTESGFFAFDSHSRSADGMLNVSGKSTRVLFQNVNEVYSHLQNLALSMGYSKNVECNVCGVTCRMDFIVNECGLFVEEEDIGKISQTPELSVETTVEKCNANDDLIFISHEQVQFSFCPLSVKLKKHLSHILKIPYICTENSDNIQCSRTNIREPRSEKNILGDGNCFFRAVSFSLTNSEDFHSAMRNAVCEHMMRNRELFKPFLKDGVDTVENHLSSTQMLQEGTWATEVEIFATAHLLNTDIYTFSDGCW
ncbi:uncharacterized protein LOC134263711 [Saccostrea cucullata]|uniref:uncharacterized protein LOC134263711 n=1 Tax=Saccostrea cuccullata TaxID=36930 RepID=UPI002ED3DFC4